MNFRASSVAISNETRWKLTRIAKAANGTADENHLSTDALAERILSEWITARHPQLDDIWKEREACEQRAEQSLAAKPETEPVPF